jgi:TcpE family
VRGQDGIAIRSFRLVFDLERRIHKVDRWRIPVPYGIPLRGIAYWALALFAMLTVGRLPVVGALTGLLPVPLRLVVIPVALAWVLTRVKLDGRPAHTALCAWARFRLAPRHLAGLRAVPAVGSVVRLADVAIVPDERAARYRRAVIDGPATVLLRYPPFGRMRASGRRRALRVKQLPGPPLFVGKQVRIKAGQRIVFEG